MNAIDMIYSNLFLKKLFPEGLPKLVYIGPFELSEAGRFSMSIHTRQKPAIEVAKWGVHGRDYDVIAINISGSGATHINIENWVNSGFAIFDFSKNCQCIRITARETDWSFDVTVESLSFQGCSVYIE